WFAQGKKQPLDLRGQLYVPEKIVTLLLDGPRKRFPLFHITPYDIDNKGEAQHRGEIVEDSKSRIYALRRIVVMEQDANDGKAVADYSAKESRADDNRKDAKVDQRKRNNEVVRISDCNNRTQDQHEGNPCRPACSHIIPEDRPEWNPLAN